MSALFRGGGGGGDLKKNNSQFGMVISFSYVLGT